MMWFSGLYWEFRGFKIFRGSSGWKCVKNWNRVEFLPLYRYPNPFHRSWPGCWFSQFLDSKVSNSMGEIWIYAWEIQNDLQRYGIWYVMSQWMGMDGGFLRRKNTGLDENYTYPKSSAQVLPSKNKDWLPHPRMINGETDMFWGSFSSKTLR